METTNYTTETLDRINRESDELFKMSPDELKSHDQYERRFTKISGSTIDKTNTVLADPDRFKKEQALIRFFAPFKRKIELEKTGDEPISFERAKTERLGLGDVLALTGVTEASSVSNQEKIANLPQAANDADGAMSQTMAA